ncbi:hypothetical protein ADK54_09645 [Streptomyces sp. WM6378]|nr:hypothetical protein ADK54_09645 [Streptomyces sp. WM6378]
MPPRRRYALSASVVHGVRFVDTGLPQELPEIRIFSECARPMSWPWTVTCRPPFSRGRCTMAVASVRRVLHALHRVDR